MFAHTGSIHVSQFALTPEDCLSVGSLDIEELEKARFNQCSPLCSVSNLAVLMDAVFTNSAISSAEHLGSALPGLSYFFARLQREHVWSQCE
jgi:hypothetical protein